MIFIRYENWRSYIKFYPVTSLLLLANLVMFIILTLSGGSTAFPVLYKFGAMISVSPEREELWRYVASMFLHNGFSHLLFNSFGLLVFAPPLERLLGSWRYALLYVSAGIVGNLFSVAGWSFGDPYVVIYSVGASGALYGVYGAFLYIALFQKHNMDDASRKTLYSLLVLGVLTSLANTQVNWLAHFGGAVAGFFIYGLIIRLTGLKRN